jgi:GTP pyrophosphokinase
VVIIALGLVGTTPIAPVVKSAFRFHKRAPVWYAKANKRRFPWEPVTLAKSGPKRKRARRRGIRGHVVPEAAPDAIRDAISSARKDLLAIAQERSFSAPEKTEEDQGERPAAAGLQQRLPTVERPIAAWKSAAETYCEVAGEQASPLQTSGVSSQTLLTAQCFNFWPTLARKLSYMTSEDRSLVWRALCVACASASTNRRSGCQPIEQFTTVALILADLKLDVATVAAGLLHNVLEETELNPEDLKTMFSEEVSTIVTGCTKVSNIRGMPAHALTDEEQAENLREMLLAMADDSRVILLKCAVRLYDMRTLSSYSCFWRERTAIAQETLDIFVPLAGKSGIYAIKAELADLAFKHLQPVEYRNLNERVENYTKESDAELGFALKWLNERIQNDELLKAHHANVDITGRVKNIHSIWQKQQTPEYDDAPVEEINDIYAARMVIDYPQQAWESEEEYRERGIALCYHVFGLLEIKLWTEILTCPSEKVFSPQWTVNGEFKDYIAVPKPNGYQSLHTVVMRDLPVEVQVRTRWMHVNAEYGVASHWLYKDEKAGLTKMRSYKLAFLDPLKNLNSEIVNSRTFMDSVRKELLGKRTFVYLPDNRILNLPRGATALDAAFKIHTDIGICMNKAYVNGEVVHASTTLQNGDRIFVETAAEPQVSEGWMASAWTRSCRAKLRQYLRAQDQLNELQAHLKEKEESSPETSPSLAPAPEPVLAEDRHHGSVDNYDPLKSLNHKTSGVTYELLSELAEGEVRRTRARRHSEEPEFALV